MTQVKDKILNIRISESDKQLIKDKAKESERSVSDFIICAAKDSVVKQKEENIVNDSARQIAKMGNNLNQITKQFNFLHKSSREPDLQMITDSLDTLNKISQDLASLRDEIRDAH